MEATEAMMSVKGAAARLGVAPATIYELVASGRLRCYRVGGGRGRIRITERQVGDYLASVETGPRPEAPPKPAARPYSPRYLRG